MVAEPDALVTARQCAAAVVIQSTYRGYRARRKLADAAIMSKPTGWWNLVDAAVLQEQTQHYYAHSKSWKARDNWKRLKRKASKVGKGLEKDHKALKLALQHWLEAVDARHRYGHNLRPYYLHWMALDTSEPFFYWLDVGAGRQVELPKCSRAKLLEEQIKYLSPEQRRHYEVAIYHGKLFYKAAGELVHTGSTKNDQKWIFVLSPSDRLYIGKKQPGVIQHSSFLAGGATVAAGRLVVEHGVLKLMEAHSGHYRPSPENFEALVQRLVQSGADLHLAKVQLVSDDMLEKKKEGKQLAGEVRAGIENAGAEGPVAVKIADQKLVTVESRPAGQPSEYLVTNMTFSKSNDTTAQNHVDVAAKDAAADRVSKEQLTNNEATVPEEPANDQAPLEPAAQEDEHKQPPTPKATVDQKPPALEDLCIAKQKPEALVLPPVGAMSSLNPNRPRTPSLPTSPGFSRIASLAELERQDLRQTLKKYGPKKSGLGTPKKGGSSTS